ncbi:MAG: hypothetical protein PHE55_13320 [Methylococcaceae bacterium]|nr:hypothetical protein [Methylococcaceae bacterium]
MTMLSRLVILGHILIVLLFARAQYHGKSFFGSDEERAQPGVTRGSFHK